MKSSQNADEFINALGATAEIIWIFYSNLVKQGFTAVQALQLTQTYLSGLILKPQPPSSDN